MNFSESRNGGDRLQSASSFTKGLCQSQTPPPESQKELLQENMIYEGDSRQLLGRIRPNSIALSFWSPPYFVGKSYEKDMSFEQWQYLLADVISKHYPIIKPGGFLVINIADILAFSDPNMPRIQADTLTAKRITITREDVLQIKREHPEANRYQLAELLGCSEQTIQRRLEGVNVRGGKYKAQTKVKLVGGLVEQWSESAGFYLYDRRIWAKDPCWENSKWHSLSYRSIDESEYIYVFWKPGEMTVDRNRLGREEWSKWGSRGVWHIPSVRQNDDHEAKFPLELAKRVIRLLSDPRDIVLDCFVGSGTTAVASILENRQYIGIELVKKYAQLARKACEEAKKNAIITQEMLDSYQQELPVHAIELSPSVSRSSTSP